ncbi:unnamed protein product [Rotaria magnacalcarata]|uniref:Uncharacterized protein n=1 Tax=Rotaria magnacalcarata TaxID=392030 RepID=A0A819CXG6_9BILA|nr:unnamed protein product [Rotaria magnacalcarata]CAF3826964.1 unnamed protein product [Rotaria magnacalcarata]
MKSVSPETKVCNVCRTTYYTWKSNNAEFGNIFSRIEEEMTDVEEMINVNSNESIDMDQGYLNNRTSRLMICCICPSNISKNSRVISSEDRYLILLNKNVFVPEDARCCPYHMVNQRPTMAAMNSIAPSSIQYKKFSSNDIQLLISKWQTYFERQKRLDFDNSEALSNDEYQAFTSLSKDQFNDSASQIAGSNIRNSSNRSIPIICELPDKRAISRALESAQVALMSEFVPYNLGFNHVDLEVAKQHLPTKKLQSPQEKIIIKTNDDSLYHWIHITRLGPFFSDFSNNDASIMKNILHRNLDKIVDLLHEFLETNNLKRLTSKWQIADHADILEVFPMLSENHIVNNITLGVFQLKRSRSYAEEKTSTTNLSGHVECVVYRCKDFPDLIRVPTRSAHVNCTTYHPIIKFTSDNTLEW